VVVVLVVLWRIIRFQDFRHRVQQLETALHEHKVRGHEQVSKVTLPLLIYVTGVTPLLPPLSVYFNRSENSLILSDK
jgi:hypothetical protein